MPADGLPVVRDVYAAFVRRDLPAVLAALTPDVLIRQASSLPWGGEYRGHEGARQFFARLLAAIDSAVSVDHIFAAGDHAVALGRTRGTVRATGAAFDVPVAHVRHVPDGRIARFEPYIDTPAMLAALAAPGERATRG